MNRFLLSVLTLSLFATAAMGAELWGSKQSDKYHLPSCRWAQRITRENLVIFPSAKEALKAGYRPCRVCRPPERGLSEKSVEERTRDLEKE